MAVVPAKQLASEIIATWPTDRPFEANTVLNEHPEFLQYKSVVLDLAFEEFTQRLERGEQVAPDTFANQFSTFQKSLVQLLEANYFMHANDLVPSEVESGEVLEVGGRLMDFELCEELGQGAFSRVFLARQEALGGREVVVKFYSGGKEAETLGKLEHPHIVPVYSVDHDPERDISALCMPYYGRTTLLDVLDAVYRRKGVPADAGPIQEALSRAEKDTPEEQPQWQRRDYVETIATIGQQLASALELTHSRLYCHGDIKPSNVLLLPDGSCRLFDFNLSFATDAPLASLGGTLPYMAPEQLDHIVQCAAARSADLPAPEKPDVRADARADLYAWAVTMYELLTGKHPHCAVDRNQPREEVAAALLERQAAPLTPIRSLNPRVPRKLADIVETCLEFDPSRRIQSAHRLSASLQQHLSRPRRTWRWVQRNKTFCAAAVMLLAAVWAAGIAVTREPADRIIRREAQQAYAGREFDEALHAYDRLIKLKPNDPAAHFGRGKTLLQMADKKDKKKAALKSFDRALELARNGKVAAWIAYELSLCQQFREAIVYYERAIDMDVETAELYNNLGHSCMQAARLSEAEGYLQESVRLNRTLREAWRNLVRLDVRISFRKRQPPNLKYVLEADQAGVEEAEYLLDRACSYALLAKMATNDVDINDYFDEAIHSMQEALKMDLHPRRISQLGSMNRQVRKDPRFTEAINSPPPVQVAQQLPRTLPPLKRSPF